MKVGVNYPASPGSLPPGRFAALAEACGFESMWAGEHPVVPVEIRGQYPQLIDGDVPEAYAQVGDPLICLAQAAATTEHLRLGTGVCLVTERHPLLLAKELATLDHFSEGRVLLGAGAGWLREELELMGTNFDTRWQRLHESADAMRALWTQEPAEFHGSVIDFPPVRCNPKPFQKTGIPILVGASGRRGREQVAAWGDGWYPVPASPESLRTDLVDLRERCARRERDFAALDISVLVPTQLDAADPALIRAYEDAGASRVVLAMGEGGDSLVRNLDPLDRSQAEASLQRLAERVL